MGKAKEKGVLVTCVAPVLLDVPQNLEELDEFQGVGHDGARTWRHFWLELLDCIPKDDRNAL